MKNMRRLGFTPAASQPARAPGQPPAGMQRAEIAEIAEMLRPDIAGCDGSSPLP